mgnify:CR=1 FL=1
MHELACTPLYFDAGDFGHVTHASLIWGIQDKSLKCCSGYLEVIPSPTIFADADVLRWCGHAIPRTNRQALGVGDGCLREAPIRPGDGSCSWQPSYPKGRTRSLLVAASGGCDSLQALYPRICSFSAENPLAASMQHHETFV